MLTPGTITVTKHSSAIVGSGTDFDCDDNLEGKYIKIIGNDVWYLIKTVTDDTNIILDRAYRGETAAGVYYELGSDTLFGEINLDIDTDTKAGQFDI